MTGVDLTEVTGMGETSVLQILSETGTDMQRWPCALEAFYRCLRARCGAPKAITATAHKLARIFYSMLTHRVPFEDLGQDYYEQRYRERVTAQLRRRAARMGFDLQPIPAYTA